MEEYIPKLHIHQQLQLPVMPYYWFLVTPRSTIHEDRHGYTCLANGPSKTLDFDFQLQQNPTTLDQTTL